MIPAFDTRMPTGPNFSSTEVNAASTSLALVTSHFTANTSSGGGEELYREAVLRVGGEAEEFQAEQCQRAGAEIIADADDERGREDDDDAGDDFAGTVHLIFQPAEEGGGGGKEMVEAGMMDRFAIASVYGLHNFPGLPVGQFAIRKGGLLASVNEFEIVVTGKGGHAAMPHTTIDPVHIGAQIVTALQAIAGRNADPLESVVVSVTRFNAGEANNVIPQTARLIGTIRSLKREVRDLALANVRRIAEGIAASLGGTAAVSDIGVPYPVTFNHDRETDIAAGVASKVAGERNVTTDCPPIMGGEDFAFMLESRPGAFIFMGNGDTPFCHHPAYDFNDTALLHGAQLHVAIARRRLPAG